MNWKKAVLFLEKKNQKDFYKLDLRRSRFPVMPAKAGIHVFLKDSK